MRNEYQYPDGHRGPARQFVFNKQRHQASCLARRPGESDREWANRLEVVGVTIFLIDDCANDSNLFDPGEVEAVEKDGITFESYPNPVAKVPLWNTATREQMFISAGADLPPGYTDIEPPDSLFVDWSGDGWFIDKDAVSSVARTERDRLLSKSDWTQLLDSSLTAEQVEAWQGYRQQLRDVPGQAEFPMNVVWPECPVQ